MRPAEKLMGLATIALTLAYNPATARSSRAPRIDPLSQLGSVMAANDITLLGDTAHEDPSIHDFVASPAFMLTAQEAGVKQIGVEYFQCAQPAVDRYEEGKTTPEQLQREIKNAYAADGITLLPTIDANKWFANAVALVVNAKKENIRVVFMDNLQGQSSSQQVKYWNDLSSSYKSYLQKKSYPVLTNQQYECRFDMKNPREYQSQYDQMILNRTSVATNVSILQSLFGSRTGTPDYSPASKTVILYGAAHLPGMVQILSQQQISVAAVNIDGRGIAAAQVQNACPALYSLRLVTAPLGNYQSVDLARDQWNPTPFAGLSRMASTARTTNARAP